MFGDIKRREERFEASGGGGEEKGVITVTGLKRVPFVLCHRAVVLSINPFLGTINGFGTTPRGTLVNKAINMQEEEKKRNS